MNLTEGTAGLHGRLTGVVAVVALALCAVGFAQNRSVARDVVWPGFDVQYRELASAQTLLDEGYGPDSAYSREHAWYNPMTAWIIAAASRTTGMPAPAVVNRLGPYVNLTAPVALFVMMAVLFDGVAAVAALAAFIFLVGTEFPFYYSATYSPWFAPESFGQAPLYLLLAAVCRAFRPGSSLGWSVACGVLLGVTFLTHTAPALLGGAVIVVVGALEMRRMGDARESLSRIAVALTVALAVSLPFAFEILWRYHLKILNQLPSASPSNLLDLNELPSLARTIALPAAVAAVALGIRAVRRLNQELRVTLVFGAVVVLFLAVHVIRLLLAKAGVDLPPVVPALHFFFYLMTLVAVGVGVAIADASAVIVRRLGWGSPTADGRFAGGLLACAMTIALVAAAYPRYLQRRDFTGTKIEATELSERFPADVVAWIRANTVPEDVFLCTDDASLFVVPPAGRKVVATNRYFSNPYADWTARDADRRRMFELLRRHDVDGFRTVAARYGVRFVLLTRDRSREWLRPAGLRPGDLPDLDAGNLKDLPELAMEFENERFAILSVQSAQGNESTAAGIHRPVECRGGQPIVAAARRSAQPCARSVPRGTLK